MYACRIKLKQYAQTLPNNSKRKKANSKAIMQRTINNYEATPLASRCRYRNFGLPR